MHPKPYFPRTAARGLGRVSCRMLPDRPLEIGPIFDHEHAQSPLSTFSLKLHNQNYPALSSDGIAVAPVQPEQSPDEYLVPSLAHDERLRLTVLWYYTRHIEEDQGLLAKFDAIATIVQQTIGWEFAIIGILDEAVYTRLATANLPIALLPRRESTCAHTINQNPGTVFMSNDLHNDWRFKNSPHVKVGGLRSYAGTQLLVMTDDGQEVALGSLCVASNSVEKPLTANQISSLVHFAEILSHEITERTRHTRFTQRGVMNDLLTNLESQLDRPGFDKSLSQAVQDLYPGAKISMQTSRTGTISLSNREPISYLETEQNMWEDTVFIENAIDNQNYNRLIANQSVRAVVARCGSSNQYFVIATNDIHHVFDDTDAWFVGKCAALLAETLQRRLLKHALEAKELFLRNITHQLRTPIHGILASVDLLSEEVELQDTPKVRNSEDNIETHPLLPSAYIATIRSSGRELMSTVNNILRFNTLTDHTLEDNIAELKYNLININHDALTDALQLVPVEQLPAVSIQIENKLPRTQQMLSTSQLWIKECIQPLLLNGIQSVLVNGCGVVAMIASYEIDTQSLSFDIKDNGIGIKAADQDRIFSAFEKVDDYKAGAGLGLTLARRIAERHDGSISLIASREHCGSHFQAVFRKVKLSPCADNIQSKPTPLKHLPRGFRKVQNFPEHGHMLDHLSNHLVSLGYREKDEVDTNFILTDLPLDGNNSVQMLGKPEVSTFVIAYTDKHIVKPVRILSGSFTIFMVSGPFHTSRLNDLLRQADNHFVEMTRLKTTLPLLPTRSGATVTTLNTSSSTHLSPHPHPPQHSNSEPNLSLTKPTIKALLVDDNAINLRILEMFCQKRGIPYVTAQDGHKAEEEFRKTMQTPGQHINLVLMDLQMPNCNGIEATRAIRNIEKEHKLPRSSIFMVTGQDSPNDKSQSEEAGADEFLVKPVGLKVLAQQIEKHLG